MSSRTEKLEFNCPVCSMVPYGALCTTCNNIQTSRAMILATPPAAPWPIVYRLGDWEGSKKPEEELLQALDVGLLEQLNFAHELDEWGRRVYNDCGNRIIYCLNEDGNTATGSEAWYPNYIPGECEEHLGRRADRRDDVAIAGFEAASSEAYYPMSIMGEHHEPAEWRIATQDDAAIIEFEQQRLTQFLAAQDHEIPQFQSDRERVAAWIAASSGTEIPDVSVMDCETVNQDIPMT